MGKEAQELCPACTLSTQAAWATDRLGASSPLFPTASGGCPGKRAVVDAIVVAAQLLRLDITHVSGASAFGGRSPPRGGKQ